MHFPVEVPQSPSGRLKETQTRPSHGDRPIEAPRSPTRSHHPPRSDNEKNAAPRSSQDNHAVRSGREPAHRYGYSAPPTTPDADIPPTIRPPPASLPETPTTRRDAPLPCGA